MKTCSKCKQAKPLGEFHKRAISPDGLAYNCKACVNARSEEWRQRNPDAHQRWYEENREHKLKYWAEWRSKNKDQIKATYAAWAKENRPHLTADMARRIAMKRQAVPAWADHVAIEAFYAEAYRLTKETGIPHEVDHIVPLNSKLVQGLHWEGNLQVITQYENLSKKNRHWPDMPC